MFRKLMMYWILSLAVTMVRAQAATNLTASEIAERNATARGGLQKWRSVQTLTMHGKLEVGGNSRAALPMPGPKDKQFMPPPRPAEQARLPFMMELKRPRKVRIEVELIIRPQCRSSTEATDGSCAPF